MPDATIAARAWRRGDFATAVTHYEAVVRLEPGRARPNFLLGRSLERLGESAKARARYERALAIDPQLSEARNALTELRRRETRPRESKATPGNAGP